MDRSDFKMLLSRIRTYSENPAYFQELANDMRQYDKQLSEKLDRTAACLREVNEHVKSRREK